jgi:hypothetical protein
MEQKEKQELYNTVHKLSNERNLTVLWQVIKIMYDRQEFCEDVYRDFTKYGHVNDEVIKTQLDQYNEAIKNLLSL